MGCDDARGAAVLQVTGLSMEDALMMPVKDLLKIIQEKVVRSTYFGIPTMKSPMDFWIYQEIIAELRPDVIIELGTWHGGSALALAHMCDVLGHGRVISIDINPSPAFTHPRITWMTQDAVEAEVSISKSETVLVIDDSSHTYDNTLAVLRRFSPLVSVGSYFIVEDSICGHGLDIEPMPGPYEAVQTFLSENKNFEVDRNREAYLITWNPSGYLKRVS